MTPGPFSAALLSAKAGDPPPGVDPWSLPWYHVPSLEAGVVVYAVLATEAKGTSLLLPAEAVPLLF